MNTVIQLGNDLTNKSQIVNYDRKYGNLIDMCQEVMRKKFKYEWKDNDTLAFGRYADTWQEYKPVLEADMTTRSTLGEPLSSNLGLVAMSYAALPIQNFASIQPLSEESGTVYYRNGIATMDRGGVAKGDSLISPMGAVNAGISNYVSETQVLSKKIENNTTLEYNDLQLGKEIIKGQIRISVAGNKVKGMDDGEGHILGVGIDASGSTINYETGALTIKFTDLTGAGVQNNDMMDITYQQSTLAADQVPTMKWTLDGKVVRVDYDILQSNYSSIAEVVLRKRFGTDLNDQITMDLVTQITSSILLKSITKLRNASIQNETLLNDKITWSMKPKDGVSEIDHRRTFDDNFVTAVDMMFRLAGKGEISTIITGMKGKTVLQSSGMKLMRNSVSGPHLCGMYGDIPVYYAPNSALGKNEMLVIYRGTNWYEAPLVYAPFLPVTVTAGRSVHNVLQNSQAVYHASALETVMSGFCIRITLTD